MWKYIEYIIFVEDSLKFLKNEHATCSSHILYFKKKGIMLFRKHSLFFKIHENKMNAKHKEIGTTNVEQNPHEMDM